jgi:hypothetical protein
MPIESILTILSFVADKVAGKIIETGVETAWAGIGGDDARRGFRRALEAAVQRYATGKRLALVRALAEGGVLSDPEVIEELAHIADSGRRPNIRLIARKWKAALLALPRNAELTELWKAALNDPAAGWDFSDEASALLGYLAEELRQTKEFQPLFSAGDLREVETSTAAVEARIADLNELLNTKLSALAELFASATAPVRSEIVDFLPLIQEKTRDFVGRRFVFDAVSRFSNENRRGYFLIQGEPGIGKTALMAQLVKQNGYLHHFSVRVFKGHREFADIDSGSETR